MSQTDVTNTPSSEEWTPLNPSPGFAWTAPGTTLVGVWMGSTTGEKGPRATRFYVGPWDNRNLFKALSHAIQTHFRDRRPPYPVERTLLTTGTLAAAMDSRAAGKPLETPHLAFGYEPRDFSAMREMGATWKIITEGTPEPKWIDHAPR